MRDEPGDEVVRHPAPAETGEEKIQPLAEVHEAPAPGAQQAIARAVGIDRVGQHELNMGFEVAAGRRAGERREGMAGRRDGLHGDAQQLVGGDVVGNARQQKADRKRRRAAAQAPERSAQPFGGEAARQVGDGFAQRTQAVDQRRRGRQRV